MLLPQVRYNLISLDSTHSLLLPTSFRSHSHPFLPLSHPSLISLYLYPAHLLAYLSVHQRCSNPQLSDPAIHQDGLCPSPLSYSNYPPPILPLSFIIICLFLPSLPPILTSRLHITTSPSFPSVPLFTPLPSPPLTAHVSHRSAEPHRGDVPAR